MIHPNRYRVSRFAWSVMEKTAQRWRKLDQKFQGKHDQFLDKLISKLRGRNALHPFWYYQDGWGDFTIPSSFYAWLETFQKETEALKKFNTPQRSWLPRKVKIDLTQKSEPIRGVVIQEGLFSTSALEVSNLLPKESLQARVLFVSPKHALDNNPTTILLAGTGEHGYSRRFSSIALPLALESGISSVILESPYYGSRRPPNQVGSKLRRVSDLAVLGRVTIEETCSLLKYLSEERSCNKLAVAGVSMGGLHSAMSASLSPLPIGVVSWLGPPSAAPVFTEGLLSRFCEWKRLQSEVGNQACAKAVMNDFLSLTNIGNFPSPVDPSRGIFVIAENDLYVPLEVSKEIWHNMQKGKWQGARVVAIRGGHVSATLFGSETMRKCIENVLEVRKDDPFAT